MFCVYILFLDWSIFEFVVYLNRNIGYAIYQYIGIYREANTITESVSYRRCPKLQNASRNHINKRISLHIHQVAVCDFELTVFTVSISRIILCVAYYLLTVRTCASRKCLARNYTNNRREGHSLLVLAITYLITYVHPTGNNTASLYNCT